MIHTFDDFCWWMFVLVDDCWQQIAPLLQRPGPRPLCSDSELVTLALLSECLGWDKETDLIRLWRTQGRLFPHLPSRSRFNRRRRALAGAINRLRQLILRSLDLADDPQCVIDSLPVPVMGFHLVPGGSREWAAHGATYGRCASKKQTIFGYKLHCVMTLGGVILDFAVTPANVDDLTAGQDLLFGLQNRLVVGDKGYSSAPLAAELAGQGVELVTLPRSKQQRQLRAAARSLINGVRQIIDRIHHCRQQDGLFRLGQPAFGVPSRYLLPQRINLLPLACVKNIRSKS